MDRRLFLIGSSSAVAVTAVIPSALAHNCFDHCGDGCKGLCAHPSWSRELLTKAWAITEGKLPQQMHQALVREFGPFPIWFIDDQAHVVILGVLDVSQDALDRLRQGHDQPLKGYWLCDTRIIRERNSQGEWEQRDTLDRPQRHHSSYVI
jgi:hypothetical protein